MFGSRDDNSSEVNLILEGIFGSAYGNVAQQQTGGGSDFVYPIANNPNDPIINGPFGNLAGKYWGEDNVSTGSIIVTKLPPGSVQVCSAMTPYGKPNHNPGYSIVWYNNSKNFMYFGDSTGSSHNNMATGECPAYYPSNKPGIKRYGPGGSNNQYVYNAALELNGVAWMIKRAAVSGINPH
jgi:hypothetical protein